MCMLNAAAEYVYVKLHVCMLMDWACIYPDTLDMQFILFHCSRKMDQQESNDMKCNQS